MPDSKPGKKLRLTPSELEKLKNRLTRNSRKVAGMERRMQRLRNEQTLILKELRLSTKKDRERAAKEGSVFTKMMSYIVDIKDILVVMKNTFFEIYNNESKLVERAELLHELMVKSDEKITETMEKYRVLSHLGELDTKILALKLAGVTIDEAISHDLTELRSSIMSGENISLEEVQKRSVELFNRFADNLDRAIDSMSYKGETKEILESMREVAWM